MLISREKRRCYHASTLSRYLLTIGAALSLLLAAACTGTESDDGDEAATSEDNDETELDADSNDLEVIGLISSELSDLSESGTVVVGSSALVSVPDQLIDFYRSVQPGVNEPALIRRLSRLRLEAAHARTFVFAEGDTGVIQVLYLFADAEGAGRYLEAAPPGYEDDEQTERSVDQIADQTIAYEGEFDSNDGPTGFATVLTRFDNLVSQVIVGTVGVDDPYFTALEASKRQDERVQDFVAGLPLVSIAEERQVADTPDPRSQQLAELLLVASDLDAYGEFQVLTEVPNDDPAAVIAFLSNSENINDGIEQLLADEGLISGSARLLGTAAQDETGLAVVSQVLLFELAAGAVNFLTGATDLDVADQPASEHEVMVGDAARSFCRTRDNGHFDCELRFARDNIFAAVAVLNFLDEASGVAATIELAGIVDELIVGRP